MYRGGSLARVNQQHPPVHREGWMIIGQEIVTLLSWRDHGETRH